MTRTRLFVLAGALVALGATTLICLPPSKKLMLAAQTQPVTNRAASSRAKLVRSSAASPAAQPPVAAEVNGAPAPLAPPGTVLHVARRGESMASLVRTYLSPSSFMTGAELEAAVRQANPGLTGTYLKPGEPVIVPGMNGPIVERSLAVSKDYEVRAVYLTGIMAASARGMEIVRRWRAVGGNAVVFDVKDSDGIVNIPFEHSLNVNAPRPVIRNLPKFTRWLHQQGMMAIARVAIFRDERMVSKHPELAIRSRQSGQPWRENGKLVWTDPSRPEVQEFNIALAREAAKAGVDEIQFDYVRFPAEGAQKDAQFAFEKMHKDWQRTDVIADFLARAHAELKPLNVLISLDVFGVMAWQRSVDLAHTGQDIVRMARHCDVLSPMIYPSHFYGMDGYALPGDAPEHFISSSMERFQQITAGSGVVLRPWLQAFGWRTKTYSPAYVATQVRVARQKGGLGFLFWNARNDYSKPYAAMPEMQRDRDKFFRGDELPSAKVPGAPLPAGD